LSKAQREVEGLQKAVKEEEGRYTYLNDQVLGLRAMTEANVADMEALKEWTNEQLSALGEGVHEARLRDRARMEAMEVEVRRACGDMRKEVERMQREREGEQENMEGMRQGLEILRAELTRSLKVVRTLEDKVGGNQGWEERSNRHTLKEEELHQGLLALKEVGESWDMHFMEELKGLIQVQKSMQEHMILMYQE
jgi:hypothetical protein